MVSGRQVTEEVVAAVRQETRLGDHAQAKPGEFWYQFARDEGGVLDPVAGQRPGVAQHRDQQDQRLAGHAVHRDRTACRMRDRDTLCQFCVRGETGVGKDDLVRPHGQPRSIGNRGAERDPEQVNPRRQVTGADGVADRGDHRGREVRSRVRDGGDTEAEQFPAHRGQAGQWPGRQPAAQPVVRSP